MHDESAVGSKLQEYDVAIIGGGPAGSTAGALLKKYDPSLSIAIIEKESFPRDHVGESHLPAISEILSEMEVWDKVEAADFPVKIGATYKWGSTDEIWDLDFLDHQRFEDQPRPSPYAGQRLKTAFQVDRSIYDKILLDHAQSFGCEVFEESRVSEVETNSDRIENLTILRSGNSVGHLKAKYYIDASGEAGILRRSLNVPVDAPTLLRNIAIWDYWQDASWAVTLGNGGTRIVVMSLGWGWLWFIPITPTRTSVGLVLPASYYKESGKTKEELYQDAIQTEPYISKLLSNARSEGTITATKDWNFIADRLAGSNWYLVGDSCGFADPILSAGMTLAHASGRKVAYSILETERGIHDSAWIKREYSEGHREQIKHHMRFADFWYSANGRFTDLKDYCSEIAKSAGLSLDSDSAFRWLATGGFTSEDPRLPRALGFGITGLKMITDRLDGHGHDWELRKTNFWRLDLSNSVEEPFAEYDNGHVNPIRSFHRDGKRIPITGLFAVVIQSLQRNADSVLVLEDCVNALIGDGCPTEEAVRLSLETIEAMIVEGWIKGKSISSRPFIKINLSSNVR